MARILLIEDNRDHLEMMAYLLRAHGHTALSAGSAESGQVMLGCCEEIDVIVCDIQLGVASGIDIVRALRKSGRLAGTRVVAVTAGSVGQAQEAFAAGCDHYMLKPIDPETFVAEILGMKGAAAPERKPIQPPAPLPVPAERPDKGATILAVDDRAPNLQLLHALLTAVGYRVVTAGGVREALGSARQLEPDLIITDVHMGDGSGFDLIRQIQADGTLRGIPWLVTSATYLALDSRAAEIGLDDAKFLLQPWEPQDLLLKIDQRLDQAGNAHGRSAGAN